MQTYFCCHLGDNVISLDIISMFQYCSDHVNFHQEVTANDLIKNESYGNKSDDYGGMYFPIKAVLVRKLQKNQLRQKWSVLKKFLVLHLGLPKSPNFGLG